jgi:hypothetical protein
MRELIAMMAGTLPKDKLVQMLKESCEEWLVNPSDENFDKISMHSALVVSRATMKNDGGFEDIQEQIDELNRIEKGSDLLNPDKNQS